MLHAANVGDARVVVSQNQTALRLSWDHRAEDPGEVERIEKAGGFVFRNRVLGILAVTRSLGDHAVKEFVIGAPHTSSLENARTGDFVILACDGLWDVFSDQEAIDMVLKTKEGTSDVSKVLVDEAIRRGSTDNITVVVAWL